MDQAEAIYEAARSGDLDELRRLIEAGADVNTREDEDGLTPLCYAALTDQVAAAGYLVEHGADPFMDSSRAFDTACGQNATGVSSFLYGLQTQRRPDHFGTPLHAAAILGLKDVLAGSIDAGADVNQRDHHAQAAIHYAFADLFPHLVHRANLILQSRDSAFVLAERYQRIAENAATRVRRLAYGERLTWDPRIKDPLPIVSVLVAHGADVNLDGTESPLSLAVRQGNLEAAKYLIANGADVSVEVAGRNLIHIAAHEGQAAMISFLLEKGLKLDQQDNWGWTPMHSAAWMGHLEAVRVLLERGAGKDKRNQQGRTPKGEAERRLASEQSTADYLDYLDEDERALRREFADQLQTVLQVLS